MRLRCQGIHSLNFGCDGKSGAEVVLAQHRTVQDAETYGHYTVKLYRREVLHDEAGAPVGVRFVLSPSSSDPSFQPIVLEYLAEGELEIIAEMVEVLSLPG